MTLKKFIIGTAQIGSIYGISNEKKKKLSFIEIKKILKKSKSLGIKDLDTAISYNNDKILGKVGVKSFNINTKISIFKFKNKNDITKFYEKKIIKSLKNLKIKKFNSILIHNPDELKKDNNSKLIYKSLILLKKKKLFRKIGISIYNFNQLKRLLKYYKFDIIQLPFNVFDQRLIKNNFIEKLHSKKIEIHVRSIFLQGLLLMKNNKINKKFKKWKKAINKWAEYTQDDRLIKLNTCINFVKSNSRISKILIGVNSVKELEEINNSKFKCLNLPNFKLSNKNKLINATYWKNLN
tara:strand:+ start:815 stop:1696 length:882 start_codon:yes stop_codon:yes gene_type:complete